MDLATPYDIVQLTETASTQDEAAKLFAETATPTLVVADRQVAGRGRQGRTWIQPDRALFSSLSFRNVWPMDRKTLIPLITADAVGDAIANVCGVEVGLKWPNDVLIAGDKVGGILVESSGDVVTVGCGLNIWWETPMDGAATLFSKDPGRSVVIDLANLWATGLLGQLEHHSDAWDRQSYLSRSVTVGEHVQWEDGEGRAVGIGDDGSLIVDTTEGRTAIHAGEVHLRKRG